MDVESSCESDISDSWSVIDVNTNEEPVVVRELYSSENPEESPPLENQNTSKEAEECNEKVNERADDSFKSQSKLRSNVCYKNIRNINSSVDNSSSQNEENDSCDDDSVEVLDEDENERDIDNLDISVISNTDDSNCNCDDLCLLKGNFEESRKPILLNSVQRKNKRKKIFSASSFNSSNSDESDEVNEDWKNNYDLRIQVYKIDKSSSSWFNNKSVRNKILNLLSSIVFTALACFAIGQFMGDFYEKSSDLMKTVRKLEMENMALQTHLSNFNKEFIEKKSAAEPIQSYTSESDAYFLERMLSAFESVNSGKVTASDSPNNVNTVEWLTKIHNSLKTKQCLPSESAVDLSKVVKYFNSHINLLNGGSKDATVKYLKDILNVLQNILTRLSSSQNNLENVYKKLISLRKKLNKKLNKVFLDKNSCFTEGELATEHYVAQSKFDILQQSSREDFGNKNLGKKGNELNLYFKFPQPKEYYDNKENPVEQSVVSIEAKNNNLEKNKDAYETNENTTPSFNHVKDKINFNSNASKIIDDVVYKMETNGNQNKIKKKETKRKKQETTKIYNKKNKKKRMTQKEKEKVQNKYEKKVLDVNKKNKVINAQNWKNQFNETKKSSEFSKKKKHFKVLKESYPNHYDKNLKPLKFSKPQHKKRIKSKFYSIGANFKPVQYKIENLNGTKSWVFKWADGRELFRRHQTLSDWQFERAKFRNDMRNEYESSMNWQFKRAMARESERTNYYWDDKSHKSQNKKEFFQDDFFWM